MKPAYHAGTLPFSYGSCSAFLLWPISSQSYVSQPYTFSPYPSSSLYKLPFVLLILFASSPTQDTDMATTAASFTSARASGAFVNFGSRTQKRMNKVVYIGGLNSYGGLKAHNNVVSLGMPITTEQCFSKVISSLKAASNAKGRGGGALSSKCADVGEIFRIAAIMNGLVLIGVAVGFVLLRIEAWVEESES